MNDKDFIKGTKDNYTHIKFYYLNMTQIMNKETHKNYYPNAALACQKFEYLIEKPR